MVFVLLIFFTHAISTLVVNPGGCPPSWSDTGIECCISQMPPGPFLPEKTSLFHRSDVKQIVHSECGYCYLQFDMSFHRLAIPEFIADIKYAKPEWHISQNRQLVVTPDKEVWACPLNYYCALITEPSKETECRTRRESARVISDVIKMDVRNVLAQNMTVDFIFLNKISF